MGSNYSELYQHVLELQRETENATLQVQVAIHGRGSPERFSELSRKVEELRDQCDVLIKVLGGRP